MVTRGISRPEGFGATVIAMEKDWRKLLILGAVAVLILFLLVSSGKIGIDKRDEHGMTALMYAAQRGDRVQAELLIARGASINARVPTRDLREFIAFISWMQQLPSSDIGYTPLLYAAQGGHANVAQLLIQKGADIHHAARGGETALDLAVWRSDLEMIQLLTDAGVRVEARQLAMAVARSTPETVRFLLEHGADANATGSVNPQVSGPPPLPPVIMAAQRGDPAVLKLLIDAGADVSAQDRNGWSALRWARHSESRRQPYEKTLVPIIEQLEAAGAHDDAGDKAAALFNAVLRKDASAVRQVLAQGANANAKDDRGVPPLIYAGNLGQAEVVEALIDGGADVNVNPEHDTTPLIAAVTGGSLEAVKKLLAAGARIDQADRLNRTPMQAASSWNRNEIATLFLDSSAKIDHGALAIAALGGNSNQVRMLLAHGADPNAGRGNVLSEAARGCVKRDNTDVIRLLLDGGANAKIADESGYTPLHRAAGLCEPETIGLLLQHGADPNARDSNQVTPLISAAASGKRENLRLLINAGADVRARDRDGKSVLEYAARYPEVQEELRRAGAR